MARSLSVTIPGNPIVKKNNQRVSMRGNRPIKYNTKAYTAWHKVACETIGYSRMAQGIDSPVILNCQFYMSTRRNVDLSALYEGIQDVLVEMGVLVDDNSKIVIAHDGSRVHYDKENPRLEVHITPVKQGE